MLGQLAFGGPLPEQGVAGGRLGFAHQPQFFGAGIAFSLEVVADLVLAIEAIQFGEIELGVVILDEGCPVATLGQPAQPAQPHPVGLWQVAVLGQKLFDFGVTGRFEACGQLVVGQVRGQRVRAQGGGILKVRAGVTFGQGALGVIVQLTLLGQVCSQR